MMKLTSASTGLLPMANDLTRLETRFWGDDAGLAEAQNAIGRPLDATAAYEAGWSPTSWTTSTGRTNCG